MRRFLAWLVALFTGTLFRVPTTTSALTAGGSAPAPTGWTLSSGVRYRLRLLVDGGKRPAGSVAAGEIVAALEDRGFVGVVAYMTPGELPAGWPESGASSAVAPNWIAWAEGTWAHASSSGVDDTFDFFRVARTDRADAPAAPSATTTPLATTTTNTPTPTRPDVKLTASTPWAYYEGLYAMAKRRTWNGLALMMVQFSESRINPAAWHRTASGDPDQGASGIIQFLVLKDASGRPTIDTLTACGWTRGAAAFRKLTADAQLPYVERYYAGWKLPANASPTQVYLVNYEPAKVAHAGDPTYVLDRAGDKNYEGNHAAFDPNGKGWIQVSDLTTWLASECQGPTWLEHVARYKWVEAQGGTSGTGGLWKAAAVVSVLGACVFVGAMAYEIVDRVAKGA